MKLSKLDRLPDIIRKSIPEEEKIYWSGEPSWLSFGYNAFGCKYLTLYFLFSAIYAISQIELKFSLGTFFSQYLPFLVSGTIAGVILYSLAFLAAKHTCYVITKKRVVVRTGVALVFLLNIPLKNVISIDKQSLSRGLGNLSFKVKSKKRIPFFSCWPSVRGSSFFEPVPVFRSITHIEEVSRLVGELAEENRPSKEFRPKNENSGVAA